MNDNAIKELTEQKTEKERILFNNLNVSQMHVDKENIPTRA